MFCPVCTCECRKFGKNRNGSQRFRCDVCEKTFTDAATQPTDRRKLDAEKAVMCLRMLLEGNSIRSTERLTGVARNTIMTTMVDVGIKCKSFMERTLVGIPVDNVQADEIWGFVGCKERTKNIKGHGDEVGDAWCFVGITRKTKLILTYHLGKRGVEDTRTFCHKLRKATSGKIQLSTDGYRPYLTAVWDAFKNEVDYGQLVKVYATPSGGKSQSRYSPGEVVDAYAVPCIGEPEMDDVCTSHAERQNLNIRMGIRRMTRLTNGHSKKWENHDAALALYFAYHNFCRVHTTLKTTPAVAAGLTDHVWSVSELLEQIG